MFKKQSEAGNNVAVVNPEPKSRKISFQSLISQTLSSEGTIVLKGNLRIDGKHNGNIYKASDMQGELVVYVGPGGYVRGEVNADLIIIDGTVEGIAKTNTDLHIRESGKLIGRGFYKSAIKVEGDIEGEVKKFVTLSGEQMVQQQSPVPNNVTPLGPKRDANT